MRICTVVFFAVLVAQSSASFFDTIRGAFQPLQKSVGKLYNDVVSDLKLTIDCTMMAVEHWFSWKSMFGRNAEYYEELCNGRTKNISTPLNDAYNMASKDISAKEQPINQNTIKKSAVDEQERKIIEEAFLNETERLQKVHRLICEELDKLTNDVEKTIKRLDHDVASTETVLGEVKQLYQMEQLNRTSPKANEVRSTFDKVLSLLKINDTGGGGVYSDDDEVKEIMKGIGKLLGNAVDDVEKNIIEWKQETTRVQQTMNKNNTLDHNVVQNKDGNKIKRQSDILNSSDVFSTFESQNTSDFSNDTEPSSTIPYVYLNSLSSKIQKADKKNYSRQSAEQTKEIIQKSSEILHPPTSNSTKSDQPLNNNVKSDISNAPEYTQLSFKGIQFQKAFDILNYTQKYPIESVQSNELPNTLIQQAPNSIAISKKIGINVETPDQVKDLSKDSINEDVQLNRVNDSNSWPGKSNQTNNQDLEQHIQNQTVSGVIIKSPVENNTINNESVRKESNLNLSDKDLDPLFAGWHLIKNTHETNNKSLTDKTSVKGLNYRNSVLNSTQAESLAERLKLIKESDDAMYQESTIENNQLKDVQNKTKIIQQNKQTSNPKHDSYSQQVKIPLTSVENYSKVISEDSQQLSIKNDQDKNLTTYAMLQNNPEIHDISPLKSSSCVNEISEHMEKNETKILCSDINSEIVVRGNQSLNATEKFEPSKQNTLNVNIENNQSLLNTDHNLMSENNNTLSEENKSDLLQKENHQPRVENKSFNIFGEPLNTELNQNNSQSDGIENGSKKIGINILSSNYNSEFIKTNKSPERAQKYPEVSSNILSSVKKNSIEGNSQALSRENKTENVTESSKSSNAKNMDTKALKSNETLNNNPSTNEIFSNLIAQKILQEINQLKTVEIKSEMIQKPASVEMSQMKEVNNGLSALESSNMTKVNKNLLDSGMKECNLSSNLPENGKIIEHLNEVRIPDLIQACDLPNCSAKKEQLNEIKTPNKSRLSGCQETQIDSSNVDEKHKNTSNVDEKYENTNDTNNIESHLFAEVSTSVHETLKSPNNIFEESGKAGDYPDTPLEIEETENSLNDPELQLTQSNDRYENFDKNLNSTQINAVDVSQQLETNSNSETLVENAQLPKKNYDSEVAQNSVGEYSTASIVNSSKEEFVESPSFDTFTTDSTRVDGQITGDKFYGASLRFNSVLNKQTSLDPEPGFVSDSTYSNQNMYVPTFNQSKLSRASLSDSAADYQKISGGTDFQTDSSKLIEKSNVNEKHKNTSNVDDTFIKANDKNDIKFESVLSSEVSTNESETLKSPNNIFEESDKAEDYSDIPQGIEETEKSFCDPALELIQSNDDYENFEDNLELPQKNAANPSQQFENINSNSETLVQNTQSTQERFDSEVVQPQVQLENMDFAASIKNSSKEDFVDSPSLNTFTTDPTRLEGQITEDKFYIPSPKFNPALNKQTPFETRSGFVSDSTYSNQNEYVPNSEFKLGFDQTRYSRASVPDTTSEYQQVSAGTISEIPSFINRRKEQQAFWTSYNEDYTSPSSSVYSTSSMSTEKPENFGFSSQALFDVESIIQDGQRSESFMENLFSNVDHEHNIFDMPDMLYK